MEAFTEAKEQLPENQQLWEDETNGFPNQIFSWLKTAFHYSANSLSQRAHVLAIMGKLCQLSALLSAPDPPIQWALEQFGFLEEPITKLEEKPVATDNNTRQPSPEEYEENEQENVQPEEDQVGEISEMDRHNIKVMLRENSLALERSKRYLAQAGEFLQQSVALALKLGNRQICAFSCLQLVELYGQLEPAITAHYLTVYQNCMASLYLDELVWLSQPDTNASLQASLLNQLKNFEKSHVETNLSSSPMYRNVIKILEQRSIAWRRLVVSPNQIEMFKDFPPNLSFLILQHSPDNKYLYAAIPERQVKPPKPEGGSKKNQPPNVQQALQLAQLQSQQATHARVARLDFGSSEKFEQLLSKFMVADQHVGQISLKHRYQADVVRNRQKMSATGDNAGNQDDDHKEDGEPRPGSGLSSEEDPDALEREQELKTVEEEFKENLEALNQYLEPILHQLAPSLR